MYRHGRMNRTLLTACLVFATVVASGVGFVHWARTPRVGHEQVARSLEAEFPNGTLRTVVEKSLTGRYQYPASSRHVDGHGVLQCWIGNSGCPLALFPDDIRIQFAFDDQERLTGITAVSEPRF